MLRTIGSRISPLKVLRPCRIYQPISSVYYPLDYSCVSSQRKGSPWLTNTQLLSSRSKTSLKASVKTSVKPSVKTSVKTSSKTQNSTSAKKRRRIPNKTKSYFCPPIPSKVQTLEDAEYFFDVLAPHLELHVIKMLAKKLSKFVASSNGSEQHLARKFDAQFKSAFDWISSAILSFLMGTPFENKKMLNDSKFSPNINKRTFEQQVDLLITARTFSIDRGLTWGGRKSKQKIQYDAQVRMIAHPPDHPRHFESDRDLREAAEQLAHTLAARLPPKLHSQLITLLTSFTTSEEAMKKLYPKLNNKARTHTHLVAPELAQFLNITIPSDFEYNSKLKWNKTREEVSKSLLESQNAFANQKRGSPSQALPKGDEVEDMVDAIANLRKIRSAAEAKSVNANEKLFAGAHLRLDAIILPKQIISPVKTHTIFLDNLPIDISIEELKTAYSRIGPVSSVQIYNQRLDLDPGPLSTLFIKEKRQKERFSSKKRNSVPRSPVYAKMDFETHEAYEKALDDHLTIFGMIIRKRAVRSLPPQLDILSLYINNIPPGYGTYTIEQRLSKILSPQVYVCVPKLGKNFEGDIASCEIRFESWDTVQWTYEKLKDDVSSWAEDGSCFLHYMESPPDAMSYWLREVGYYDS